MLTRAMMTVALALLAAMPALAADIRTNVDPNADFSQYRTFSFLEADGGAKGAIADPKVRDRLRNLIAQHLDRRGYKPAPPGQPGDLGVLFSGHVEPKQRVLMTGRPTPYSYTWGRTELGGQSTMNYRAGTLVVDVVDFGKSELLWRTTIREAFSAGYSEENWKKVDRALAGAFAKLPLRK